MPFGAPWMPSLALMQLRNAVHRRLGKACRVDIHYLNLDFAAWLGRPDAYALVLSGDGVLTGLGDWLFRRAAFPDAAENAADFAKTLRENVRTPEERARLAVLMAHRPAFEPWIEQTLRRLRISEIDVIGGTSLFAQQTASLALARIAKALNPSVVTVMGGAACEGPMGAALAEIAPFLDFIFTGPALDTFPALLETLLHAPAKSLAKDRALPGVVSPKTPTRRSGPPAPSTSPETDSFPDTNDYEGFLHHFEQVFPGGDRKPVLLFETSRGCWWAERQPCRFCGLNGCRRRFVALPPEEARRRIRRLSRWKDRCAALQAVDNVMPRNYPREVFANLDPPPGIPVQYEVRVGLSREELRMLHDAGVTRLQPGIEALSGETLRLMGKGVTVFDNLVFLKHCLEIGIALRWNLLIGFPGEDSRTYARYRRLLPRLRHLPPPDGVFPVDFPRFSPYFEAAEEFGLDLKPRRAYESIYPFGEALRERLAVHFVDRNADPEKLQSWLDRLNSDVALWRRRWFPPGSRAPARLTRRPLPGGGAEVLDSRFGDPLRYRIGPDAHRLLSRLDAPTAPEAIGSDEAPLLAELDARGLLFEENGRRLSLVTGKIVEGGKSRHETV